MTTLSTNARNAAVNGVTPLLNNGTIDLLTSGAVVVATLTFGATAFGAAASGVATANAIADGTAAAAGTVTNYIARTSGGVQTLAGTCSAAGGGGELILSTAAFGVGDVARATAFTYTQPA
jgi:hypothetical protein